MRTKVLENKSKFWAALTLFSLVASVTGIQIALAASTIDSVSVVGLPEECALVGQQVTVEGEATADAPPGHLFQYHVQIDWGDGNADDETEDGSFTLNNGDTPDPGTNSQTFSGTHTYTTPGDYTITARIYHQTPPGEDNQADAVATVDICVEDPQDDTTLNVFKNTVPDGDLTSFVFLLDGDGDNPFATLQDGFASGAQQVSVGQHFLSEVGQSNWYISDWQCVDESQQSVGEDMGESGIELNFAEGDDITCTFENTLDVCSNLEGDQAEIPQGYEDPNEDGVCTEIPPDQGQIITKKIAAGAAENLLFDFTATWGDTPPTPFSLVDGETNNSGGLNPGSYTITESAEPGWSLLDVTCTVTLPEVEGLSTSTSTPGGVVVTLEEGETVTCTFTNREIPNEPNTYSISGMKWGDSNGDGQKGEGENGLAGWTIFLDTNENGLLDGEEVSTQTDANGNYVFNNLENGPYTVCEVGQNSWNQTYPANPNCHSFELDDLDITDKDFGNQQESNDGGGGSSSGGGGGGGGRRSEPEPEVLGEQTEILPAGAPDTGVPAAGVNVLGMLSTLTGLIGISFVNRKK